MSLNGVHVERARRHIRHIHLFRWRDDFRGVGSGGVSGTGGQKALVGGGKQANSVFPRGFYLYFIYFKLLYLKDNHVGVFPELPLRYQNWREAGKSSGCRSKNRLIRGGKAPPGGQP